MTWTFRPGSVAADINDFEFAVMDYERLAERQQRKPNSLSVTGDRVGVLENEWQENRRILRSMRQVRKPSAGQQGSSAPQRSPRISADDPAFKSLPMSQLVRNAISAANAEECDPAIERVIPPLSLSVPYSEVFNIRDV